MPSGQESLSKTRYDHYLAEWLVALDAEIHYLREQGGTKYQLSDGKRLRSTSEGFIYLFYLNSDVTLPDAAPVRLEFENQKVFGAVVSIEGFDLVLELEEDIGQFVEEADLWSDPWKLLQALKDRLREIAVQGRTHLPLYLLHGDGESKPVPLDLAGDPIAEMQFRSRYHPTTYIWGPPGTGKTYTLASIAVWNYQLHRRVLVLSHSNAAVDVLMLKIKELLKEKGAWRPGEVVRYGTAKISSVQRDPELLAFQLAQSELEGTELLKRKKQLENQRKKLKQSLAREKTGQREASNHRSALDEELAEVEKELQNIRQAVEEREANYVQRAQVLGLTFSKAVVSKIVYQEQYDLVLVDEVSMAYIPQVVFAASLAKQNVVVCGDFRQLPPIAHAEHPMVQRWLQRDIFEQAGIVDAVERTEQAPQHPNLVILRKQRRMHRKIARFVNHRYYNSLLENVKEPMKQREQLAQLPPFPGESLSLIDLSQAGSAALTDSSRSRYNMLSAMVGMHLVAMAKDCGFSSVGFISPYRVQSLLVNTFIQEQLRETEEMEDRDILAATVHKFQGSERDLIIYDLVESYPQKYPGTLITNEKNHLHERLTNVAITRARGKWIQLTDVAYAASRLSKRHPILQLLRYIQGDGTVVRRDTLLQILRKHPLKGLRWITEDEENEWLEELTQAKEEIILSIPHATEELDLLWEKLKSVPSSVRIYILMPSKFHGHLSALPSHWVRIAKNVIDRYTIIDRKILWHGLPRQHVYVQPSDPLPPLLLARLVSPKVIRHFISFQGLRILLQGQGKIPNEPPQEAKKIVSRAFEEVAVTSDTFAPLRLTYRLREYILSQKRCVVCNSQLSAQMMPKGPIFTCDHCGKVHGLSLRWMQDFLDFIDVRCPTCHSSVNAGGRLLANCSRCGRKFHAVELW